MNPRAHTDTAPHSRRRTGPLHMLSEGGANQRLKTDKNTAVPTRSMFRSVNLFFCWDHSAETHLSRSALRPSRRCSCSVRSARRTGRRSHIHTAAGSPSRTGPPHTLCTHTAARTSRERETKQRRHGVNLRVFIVSSREIKLVAAEFRSIPATRSEAFLSMRGGAVGGLDGEKLKQAQREVGV